MSCNAINDEPHKKKKRINAKTPNGPNGATHIACQLKVKSDVETAWDDVDNILKNPISETREIEGEREIAISIFPVVEAIWKKHIYKEWLPCVLDGHYCSISGSNSKIIADNIDDCVLQLVSFKLYKTRTGEYHPCIQTYCSQNSTEDESLYLHHSYIRSYNELYMCTYSGKAHYCGKFCSITSEWHWNNSEYEYYKNHVFNRDGTLMCPLTGYCFELQKGYDVLQETLTFDVIENNRLYQEFNANCKDTMSRKERKALKVVKEGGISYEKYDPELGRKLYRTDFVKENLEGMMKFSSVVAARHKQEQKHYAELFYINMDELRPAVEGILRNPPKDIESLIRNLKVGQFQSLKEFYLVYAAIKLAYLLSPSKRSELPARSEKYQSRCFKIINMYFSKCKAENQIPNACELIDELRMEDKTINSSINYNIPIEYLLPAVVEYAKITVQAWYALMTVSEIAKENKSSFKFPDFVDTFASISRTGYNLQLPNEKNINIYLKESIFTAMITQEKEERRKGDYTSKHKRKGVTTIRRNINTALAQTIIRDNIHYQKLTPYYYEFECLQESVFLDPKEWQRSADTRRKKQRHEDDADDETPGGVVARLSFKKIITEQGERINQKLNKYYDTAHGHQTLTEWTNSVNQIEQLQQKVRMDAEVAET